MKDYEITMNIVILFISLKHQFGTKSLKMSHVIYADTESLLKKHDSCSNNPEKSYTEKKATHEACGYSMNIVRLKTTVSSNI